MTLDKRNIIILLRITLLYTLSLRRYSYDIRNMVYGQRQTVVAPIIPTAEDDTCNRLLNEHWHYTHTAYIILLYTHYCNILFIIIMWNAQHRNNGCKSASCRGPVDRGAKS